MSYKKRLKQKIVYEGASNEKVKVFYRCSQFFETNSEFFALKERIFKFNMNLILWYLGSYRDKLQTENRECEKSSIHALRVVDRHHKYYSRFHHLDIESGSGAHVSVSN